MWPTSFHIYLHSMKVSVCCESIFGDLVVPRINVLVVCWKSNESLSRLVITCWLSCGHDHIKGFGVMNNFKVDTSSSSDWPGNKWAAIKFTSDSSYWVFYICYIVLFLDHILAWCTCCTLSFICRWRCDCMCMIIAGEDVIVCVWLLQVKMWLYVYDYCRWRCGCVKLETWIFFIFARSKLMLWYMFRLSYNKRDIYRTLSLELSCRTIYGYLIVQSLIIWVFQFF